MKTVERCLTIISAIGIFLMSTLICLSVFFRYFLNTPISFTEDLTKVLLGFTIFSAYLGITVRREHVQIDLLTSLFEMVPRFNYVRFIVIDIATLGVITIVGLRLWERAEKAYSRGSFTSTTEWLLWPFIGAFSLLVGLTVVLFGLKIILDIKNSNYSKGEKND
ncbi:MAG: TRAP-type C4-dicarboxylate transport system permease small subunit [Celeribacter sp.]|jgi:TRAP-type C4-dicarboxylate transport system permease small subunit